MAVIVRQDHEEVGLSRLITIWQDKPNVTGLLKSYLEQFNAVEDLLQSILNDRSLYTAEGVQLDMIGALFNVPRGGLDDAKYRPRIVSYISRLNDDGTTERFLNMLRLVGDTDLVDFWEHPNGDVHAYLGEGIFPSLYSSVKGGTAAGVNLRIVVDEFGDSFIPAELQTVSYDLQTNESKDLQVNMPADLQVSLSETVENDFGVLPELEDTELINPPADIIFSDFRETYGLLRLEEDTGYLASEEDPLDRLLYTSYEFI